jgi:hypothetical protein
VSRQAPACIAAALRRRREPIAISSWSNAFLGTPPPGRFDDPAVDEGLHHPDGMKRTLRNVSIR